MPQSFAECPICRSLVPFEARYPEKVCDSCVAKATDVTGNRVAFYNTSISGGIAGHFVDSDSDYGSFICYIGGIKCIADEHRFGGIVIQPLQNK